MKTAEQITTTTNEMIDSGILPHLDSIEKKAAYVQATINQEAKEYLAKTDWYVVRFLETEVAIPSEISTARAAARLLVT